MTELFFCGNYKKKKYKYKIENKESVLVVNYALTSNYSLRINAYIDFRVFCDLIKKEEKKGDNTMIYIVIFDTVSYSTSETSPFF